MGVGLRKVRGFTLIELLVVIVIIGIVVGFATLSLGGDRRGDELEEESRRFAALLSLASEQAVLRGEEWAVDLDEEGYGFLALTDQGWQPVTLDPLWRERRFSRGTEIDLELEGRELVLDPEAENEPVILLLSSGEISPFVATFSARATERRYRVRANLLGELQWEPVETL